jgi:hypothetical protein
MSGGRDPEPPVRPGGVPSVVIDDARSTRSGGRPADPSPERSPGRGGARPGCFESVSLHEMGSALEIRADESSGTGAPPGDHETMPTGRRPLGERRSDSEVGVAEARGHLVPLNDRRIPSGLESPGTTTVPPMNRTAGRSRPCRQRGKNGAIAMVTSSWRNRDAQRFTTFHVMPWVSITLWAA